MIFNSGAGQMPTSSTAIANTARTPNSRPFRSVSAATLELPTGPNTTRFTSHSVYAAPRMRVVAASSEYQKLALKLARMTRNSPTKPDVPGRPVFASANSTMKAAKIGIVLITPRRGHRSGGPHLGFHRACHVEVFRRRQAVGDHGGFQRDDRRAD